MNERVELLDLSSVCAAKAQEAEEAGDPATALEWMATCAAVMAQYDELGG